MRWLSIVRSRRQHSELLDVRPNQISIYRVAHGKHDFKAGGEFRRTSMRCGHGSCSKWKTRRPFRELGIAAPLTMRDAKLTLATETAYSHVPFQLGCRPKTRRPRFCRGLRESNLSLKIFACKSLGNGQTHPEGRARPTRRLIMDLVCIVMSKPTIACLHRRASPPKSRRIQTFSHASPNGSADSDDEGSRKFTEGKNSQAGRNPPALKRAPRTL